MEEKWKLEQDSLRLSVSQRNLREDLCDANYIGGVDISFIKGNDSTAAAAYVIYSRNESKVVYEEVNEITLQAPYIPGYLAFREAKPLTNLILKQQSTSDLRPQVLFVDGNGVLHPQRCGLASHIGLYLSLPTVGIAKNLHMMEEDGLRNDAEHKARIHQDLQARGSSFPLISSSTQETLGLALRTTEASSKPVYISVGHGIDLETAKGLVLGCSSFRIPQPTRLADQLSREYIRKHFGEH